MMAATMCPHVLLGNLSRIIRNLLALTNESWP